MNYPQQVGVLSLSSQKCHHWSVGHHKCPAERKGGGDRAPFPHTPAKYQEAKVDWDMLSHLCQDPALRMSPPTLAPEQNWGSVRKKRGGTDFC